MITMSGFQRTDRREKDGYFQYKGKRGWRFTHRLIAEKKIGRRLKRDEEVHHRNRNKKDNSFFNLEVMKKEDHNWEHKDDNKQNLRRRKSIFG